MNMIIMESAIIMNKEVLEKEISIKELLKKEETSICIDKTGKLIPEIETPKIRFGIADLWNIRKKGRYSRI